MTRKSILWNRLMKTMLFSAFLLLACLFAFAWKTQGAQLTPSFESTDGSKGENILDDSNYTTEPFQTGTVLTLSATDDIGYVYVKWDKAPGKWTLTAGDKDITCGENDFLHELIPLTTAANEVSITIPDGGATVVDLYLYSKGDLPADVQAWETPCEGNADVLLISTHADDEVLFFGGIIPNYTNKADVNVQVAYFTEHYSTGENVRMHEALDGLWTMGVTHYPQFGEFEDLYSESLEEAETQYDHEAGLEYVVRTIRRFKPQVLVGQDEKGEYGHGCHMLTAELITEAVELTNDSGQYAESAKTYGIWEVPKTYLHLYQERPIELDARAPLEKFGGKTALEIAKEAYLQHDSQQWCWFYVSDGYDENGDPDGYEYSCTKYGLFGTLVGDDTVTDDILDNITVYAKQVKEVAQADVEYETDENGETVTNEAGEPVTVALAEPVTDENGEIVTDENGEVVTEDRAASSVKEDERTKTGSGSSAGKTILIIVIIIVAIIAAWLVIVNLVKRKRKKERAARRRQAQQRARAGSSSAGRGAVSGQRRAPAGGGRSASGQRNASRTNRPNR